MTVLPPEKRSPLKDKPLRQPGQSVQERLDTLREDVYIDNLVFIVIAGSIFLATVLNFFFRTPPSAAVIATGLVFGGVCPYSIPKMRRAIQEAQNLKLGRDGERIVAEHLESLQKEGAFALHDLVGGEFNLDHVILSPKGVFAIETKTYRKWGNNPKITFDGKALTIDGREPLSDVLEQARRNAKWLKGLLKESTGKDFPVRPVVVFPGWWVELTKDAKRGEVWVLEPKMLSGFMRHEPVKLADSDVSLANFHLRRFIKSS